jgi:hypothetical protein
LLATPVYQKDRKLLWNGDLMLVCELTLTEAHFSTDFRQKLRHKFRIRQQSEITLAECFIKQGPYSQHFIFFVTYEWSQYARVLKKTMLERIAWHELPSFLAPCKFSRKWTVVNRTPGAIFTTPIFLCNLQMGLVS